jgi:hypothetical protein
LNGTSFIVSVAVLNKIRVLRIPKKKKKKKKTQIHKNSPNFTDFALVTYQNDRTATPSPLHTLPPSHCHSLVPQPLPPTCTALTGCPYASSSSPKHPKKHQKSQNSPNFTDFRLVAYQNDRTATPSPLHTLPPSHCHSLSHYHVPPTCTALTGCPYASSSSPKHPKKTPKKPNFTDFALVAYQNDRADPSNPAHTLPHIHCHSFVPQPLPPTCTALTGCPYASSSSSCAMSVPLIRNRASPQAWMAVSRARGGGSRAETHTFRGQY